MNRKRPPFVRQERGQRSEVKSSWRKGRGLHSKMKLGVHGKPVSPSIGYRGPVASRGMSKKGLIPVFVHNERELLSVGKRHGAPIAHIGLKQRLAVLKLAESKKIAVINFKNIPEYTKTQEEAFAKRKNKKTKVVQAAPVVEKPKEQAQGKPEENKEETKKQLDKLLTKPQ